LDHRKLWRILFWVTFAGWILAAVLNMTGMRAGFGTNHLADIACPAWLYIAFRGLAALGRRRWIDRLVGATPERAASLLFAASTATELAQKYWPSGLFPGRFDPFDILAFGVGLLPLYLLDKKLGAGNAE
jgi:hypothetical protein